MSLATKKPPYGDEELEEFARRFADRTAWGAWLSSPDAIRGLGPALQKLGVAGYVAALEGGAIYALSFRTDGKRFFHGDQPKFDNFYWLDLDSARKVLHRVRELEQRSGKLDTLSEEELDMWLNSYEQARVEALVEVRKKLAAPGHG